MDEPISINFALKSKKNKKQEQEEEEGEGEEEGESESGEEGDEDVVMGVEDDDSDDDEFKRILKEAQENQGDDSNDEDDIDGEDVDDGDDSDDEEFQKILKEVQAEGSDDSDEEDDDEDEDDDDESDDVFQDENGMIVIQEKGKKVKKDGDGQKRKVVQVEQDPELLFEVPNFDDDSVNINVDTESGEGNNFVVNKEQIPNIKPTQAKAKNSTPKIQPENQPEKPVDKPVAKNQQKQIAPRDEENPWMKKDDDSLVASKAEPKKKGTKIFCENVAHFLFR